MDEHSHCKDYLTRFSDHIDGELSPDICEQIQEHLKGCTNCTVVFNTLQRTVELYQHLPENDALPEDVRTRLLKRLSLDDDIK